MRALAAAAATALAVIPAPLLAHGLDSPGQRSDSSVRCPGGIVSVGDATIDLLGKCGMPALREVRAHDTGVLVTVGSGFGRTLVRTTERWTYDFGSDRFLVFVTVDGGRVKAVHTGGYGYAREDAPAVPPRATCEPSAIRIGDAKLDLLARCGEPALAELREELAVRARVQEDGLGRWRAAHRDVEVWTYDFGPHAFVRFVVLLDGVVARVETGSRGYAR